MPAKYVRLKRYDPQHGCVLRQYWYKGIKFLESEGWYIVSRQTADYLEKNAIQRAEDPLSVKAFDICTEAEARSIDERESLDTAPRRAVDKARVVATDEKQTCRIRKHRRRKQKIEDAESTGDIPASTAAPEENSPGEE